MTLTEAKKLAIDTTTRKRKPQILAVDQDGVIIRDVGHPIPDEIIIGHTEYEGHYGWSLARFIEDDIECL